MKIVDFKKELENRDGIPLSKDLILFNDYELVFMDSDKSIQFNTFDEVLEYKIKNLKIKDIIMNLQGTYLSEYGGRGASSMPKGSLFGGQSGNERYKGPIKPLPPAMINTLTNQRYKSIDETLKAFGKKLANANSEYSGVIDTDGYAVDFVKGDKTSTPHLERENQYSIHNHPVKALAKEGIIGYNAPSAPDLTNWATGKGKGTIITADGNRTAYVIEKSNNFDSKKFVKAMRNASGTGSYDRDVDRFLKSNQKDLKYKYRKIKY